MRDLSRVRRALNGIFILLLFGLVFFAKDLLLPIVLGLLLALTLSPLVRGLRRMGIPPVVSAGAMIFLLAAAIASVSIVMSGTVAMWIGDAPQFGVELKRKLSVITETLTAVQNASKQVEEIADSATRDAPEVVLQRPPLLATAMSGLAGFATSLAVGMVLALFLLASGDLFYIKLVQSFQRFQDKKRALRIAYAVERKISHYLLAITCINFGLGLAVAAAFFALDMPYALAWGFLAFALNYLPYIGALAGVAASAAVAIVLFDTLGQALVVPAVYLALTSIEGHFVTPFLLGRHLQINSVSVLLTVILWGWLWGIPGALMAVPALVVLKVIADNVDSMATLSNFLSGQDEVPALDPPAETAQEQAAE